MPRCHAGAGRAYAIELASDSGAVMGPARQEFLTKAEAADLANSETALAWSLRRLAGKRAVMEALGVTPGDPDRPLTDVEILSDATGRPEVTLHGRTRAHAGDVAGIDVSLSSDSDVAVAFAAVWKGPARPSTPTP